MAKQLIIGYGNPIRGDDGLGWHVMQALGARSLPPEVELMTCQQLLPELALPISEASLLILVDAASQGEPGTVKCERIEPDTAAASSTHHVSPGALLAMAKHLFGAAPATFMVSVAAQSFECGEELTPVVRDKLPDVLKLIDELLSVGA